MSIEPTQPTKPITSWATRPLRNVGRTRVEYDGPCGSRPSKEFIGVKASRAFYTEMLAEGRNPKVSLVG